MELINYNQRLQELKEQQDTKACQTLWQESAKNVCEAFKTPPRYKSSIFRAFKQDYARAKTAYKSMVGKKYREPHLMFLKLFNL